MENSKIEWCDHTFNPWWGCQKVSEGCKNCYAETLDNRWKGGHFGPGSDRRAMSDNYWAQPVKWNAAAKKVGVKAKVFCASMGDVFEGRPDTEIHLNRLFHLILNTPYLTWQLLTKRPENIMWLLPAVWRTDFPHNIWIGASVENQKAADERILHLLQIPAAVKFLSCEPLLGPLDLNCPASLYPNGPDICCSGRDCGCMGLPIDPPLLHGISWVIAGGESGHGARPVHPDWLRSLRDQCKAANVPFFFKQYGEWSPIDQPHKQNSPKDCANNERWMNLAGGHGFHGDEVWRMRKVGKKAAGRLLDGVEHNEFPNPSTITL